MADLSVYGKLKSFSDYQQANDEFLQRKALQQAQIQEAQMRSQKLSQPNFTDVVNAAVLRAATGAPQENDANILQSYGALHPRSNVASITNKIQPAPQDQPITINPINTKQQAQKPIAPTAAPATNLNVVGDDYLKTLDPEEALRIKAIGDGDIKLSTYISRMKPAEKSAVVAHVRHYNPNYSENDIGGLMSFNKGVQGNQVRAFNTSIEHTKALEPLIDALDNGDTQAINSIGNKLSAYTGGEAVTNFNAAKTFLAGEVAKAIVGGQNAEADRAKYESMINESQSPAQLKGAVKVFKKFMGGQLKALDQQYQASTGRSDFKDRLLLPNAREEYNNQSKASSIQYNTPDDVKAAYKAGTISKEAAISALKGMGGFH